MERWVVRLLCSYDMGQRIEYRTLTDDLVS